MSYSFKNLQLKEVEKNWLQEIACAEFTKIDFNGLKVDFREALKSGFDPERIDQRLIQDGRLTLVGYWYIDPKHEILKQVCESINYVQSLIIQSKDQKQIPASTLSNELNIDRRRGEIILRLIYDLPGFFQSGAGPDTTNYGMRHAEFYKNDKAYDEFLKFNDLDEKLEEFFLNRSQVGTKRGHTNWSKVNRQLKRAGELLLQAKSVEDYQNVGLCCRETLITLGQEVYNEQTHGQVDGTKPSDTDSKRMLNAYISKELRGSSNEAFRGLVKASHRVANATQHRRTADFVQASLSVEAVTSLIEIIKVLQLQS